MPPAPKRTKQVAPLTVSRPELLVDGGDHPFRELVRDLVDFSGRLQAIRAAIALKMGVTAPQYNLLMTLAHDGDGVTVKEVARRLRVSVPFVVTESRRLEVLGLLDKRADPTDGRRVSLVLTGAAHSAIAAIAPVQRRVNDVLFGTLDKPGFEALSALTRGLVSSCDEALTKAG